MVLKGRKTCGGKRHAREETKWQNMQIIFGTHYTIATKQHFNLLIFHYALSAPPPPSRTRGWCEAKMCVITFHKRWKSSHEKVSLRLHNPHQIKANLKELTSEEKIRWKYSISWSWRYNQSRFCGWNESSISSKALASFFMQNFHCIEKFTSKFSHFVSTNFE